MTKTDPLFQPLFTGQYAESLFWPETRQAEAVAALKGLRIRPHRLSQGYCRVSYESYVKLRQAGLMVHQMSGE